MLMLGICEEIDEGLEAYRGQLKVLLKIWNKQHRVCMTMYAWRVCAA
jgi:hypothetical protein